MILFPGEEELLKDQNFVIKPSTLPEYGTIHTLICDGDCDRAYRPLACRIFPLAPKVTDEGVQVRMDARGRPTCPLTHLSLQSLSHRFLEEVKSCLNTLYQDEEQRAFIEALSKRVDSFHSFTL